MEVKFNVTGAERKKLVGAISEILNTPMKYLGAPGFAYKVGGYTVDKNGTVSGERNDALLTALAARGFEAESAVNAPSADEPEVAETSEVPDRLAIEMPMDGFTPEKLENLTKLVESKSALIKTALGTDDLPVESTGGTLRFPWFPGNLDSGTAKACAQFIAALCKTAKEKKRVTAKARDEFENPRFAMRVWLIGLGMVGGDFKLARKLLLKNLSGNAAWRYGAPEKKAANGAADGADAGTETPEAVPAPVGEEAPVGNTGANCTGEASTEQ
ncbi:virulence protein [Caproiciproducens galactitolivorans]|uniref:Virulence protein n=1 Tax=Caproiciproducens galactitolivorans TaxID=642589 RepID=A0ABT4BVR1_9FIRM|nr:virulence protein [Caproiciproducens galactitolivorans]MCY1714026.1 virulence protein [Caproiciproducens galactitolivorans]